MLKKIILGTLITGVIGALVAGAVIRTSDRLDQPLDGSGQGRGRNAQAEVGEGSRGEGRSDGNGGNGQGQNTGGGQGSGQSGNAQNGGFQGTSEGEGRQGNGGNGQGGNGQQVGGGNGQGDGTGLEVVEDWLILEGTVAAVDEDALVVEVAESELLVDGRAWTYALEQGFITEAGHEVTVTGFWEDGEFKPVELVDTTSGASVAVRDQGGRPYWAGQGRGAGA